MLKMFITVLIFTMVSAAVDESLPTRGDTAFTAMWILGIFGSVISFFCVLISTWRINHPEDEEEE